MKKNLVVLGVVLSLLSVASCAQAQPTPTEKAVTPPRPVTAAWRAEWEKVLTAAKREGVLSISTNAGATQTAALRDGFVKAYGIQVEFASGASGAELNAKLFSERQAGLYLRDIMLSGVGQFYTQLKPAAVLDPLKPQLLLPEVVDPNAWYGGGGLPFLDNEGKYVSAQSLFPYPDIIVNTDLVKPEDIRTNKDLLARRWKGNIVLLDPSISGGGRTWAGMVHLVLGPDFVRQFAAQEPVVTRDARQQIEWVARGKYPVAAGNNASAVAEFLKIGAPIRQVVASDVLHASSGQSPVLVNRAAHPNAARVFFNWLFGKDGQTVNTRAFLQQSTRLDVPTDHLPPVTVRQPAAEYIKSDAEDIVAKREQLAIESAKILGLGR